MPGRGGHLFLDTAAVATGSTRWPAVKRRRNSGGVGVFRGGAAHLTVEVKAQSVIYLEETPFFNPSLLLPHQGDAAGR